LQLFPAVLQKGTGQDPVSVPTTSSLGDPAQPARDPDGRVREDSPPVGKSEVVSLVLKFLMVFHLHLLKSAADGGGGESERGTGENVGGQAQA